MLNKNINFNKNETESKIENPAKVSAWKWNIRCIIIFPWFQKYEPCASAHVRIEGRLKVKLWWAGAGKRKKSAFFVTFSLSEGSFSNICVLSQRYSLLNKLSECIYFYITKNITSYTSYIVESLQCILK